MNLRFPHRFNNDLIIFLLLLSFCLISGLINSDSSFALAMIKILIFIIVIHLILLETNIKYELILMSFICGLSLTCIPYWCNALGLELANEVKLWRGDFLRISVQDPNSAAINIGAALIGFYSLLLMRMYAGRNVIRHLKINASYMIVGIIGSYIMIPPLIFSGSRAAIASILVSMIIIFIMLAFHKESVHNYIIPIRTIISILFVFTLALFFLLNRAIDQAPTYRAGQTLYSYSTQGIGFRAKLSLWKDAIIVALDNPISGVGNQENFRKMSESNNDIHNTYLDFAALTGIPSFLTFLFLMMKPFLSFYKLRDFASGKMRLIIFSGFSIFIFCIISIFFISIPGNKTYWLIWAILLDSIYVAAIQEKIGAQEMPPPRQPLRMSNRLIGIGSSVALME